MSICVRIAPSPTGALHVGNLRAAIFNWLYAKKQGGKFLLRIDDTDLARSTKENEARILADLRWLGLEWDAMARQSERFDRYQAAIEKLKEAGRLYPCYETEEELGLKRKSMLMRGKPPVYDRAALKLTPDDRAQLEAQGRKPHWRFLLTDEEVTWEDGIRGTVSISASDLSDPVVVREDGSLLYLLASCVDDIELGVTDIIRGEDHVSNTATQIQMIETLQDLLGAEKRTIRFAHYPLITGKEGDKLSKRLGSLGVSALRDEMEIEPMTLVSFLARLGTSLPIEPHTTPEVLIDTFDLGKISRSPSKFDTEELIRLNQRVLHHTEWETVRERVHNTLGLTRADESFWNVVRPNIAKLSEVKDWWHVTRESIGGESSAKDKAFLRDAAEALPPEPWTEETWSQWIAVLKTQSDRKGKDLFMPLRLALTGLDHGPELKALLPLIGRARAVERLNGRAA